MFLDFIWWFNDKNVFKIIIYLLKKKKFFKISHIFSFTFSRAQSPKPPHLQQGGCIHGQQHCPSYDISNIVKSLTQSGVAVNFMEWLVAIYVHSFPVSWIVKLVFSVWLIPAVMLYTLGACRLFYRVLM